MEFEPNNIFADRYELKELLGRGSFGEVWLSYDKVARVDVAIKIYIALDNRGLEDFRNEYRSVYDIQHPNILTPTHFDVWNTRPYLVMHYCPVSCDRKIGEMTEEEIWKFIADVSGGLSYLHEQDIIHRDIKPDNILQDSNGRYVLTDFGLSKKLRSSLRRNSTRAQHQEEASGSLSYMGPELFEAKPEAVKATDIWALGVTVYEMLVGELPFMGQGGIMLKNGAEIPELPERYSYGLRKLVRDCLQKNPWDRPTAAQLNGYKGMKPQPDGGGKSRPVKYIILSLIFIFCALISVPLVKHFGSEGKSDNNVEPRYVDLGLSVKWAECNLGATKPEKYGEYYQWAGTDDVSSTGINLNWSNCPYHTGSVRDSGWSKYNTKTTYGIVDNKATLEASDDAATVKLGGAWRIPTDAEWQELIDNCTWTWTTINKVEGYIVQSKKTGYTDNWIFLPAAGYLFSDYLNNVGSSGGYWSSSLNTVDPYGAHLVYFSSFGLGRYNEDRYYGQSVRPVYDNRPGVTGVSLNLNSMTLNKGDTGTLSAVVTPADAKPDLKWASSDESVATVSANGVVTAIAKGVATVTATTISGGYTASCKVKVADIIKGATDDIETYNKLVSREANNASPKFGVGNDGQGNDTADNNDHLQPSYVDLGLSVKWAAFNLGVSKPEAYGGHYQWAGTRDVSDKSVNLDWDNCPYHTGSSSLSGWTKYNTISSYGTVDNKTNLEASDDAAAVKLGGAWRMPTDAEWQELIDNCSWTWTTLNGVNGYKVRSNNTGYTDNWIFLPAAGYRDIDHLYNVGSYGYYWSSSLGTGRPCEAFGVYFDSDGVYRGSLYRYDGQSVRPVYDERPGVTGVSLNRSSMTINKGDTGTLSAVVTPADANPDVKWTSSDESVATVSATGVVTALDKGVATITATTVSGVYTAICKVKVAEILEGAIDLGLSVKWAECNLGASKPEDYGGYYQWAGTRDVSDTSFYLDWDNCPYHTGSNRESGWTKYNTKPSHGTFDNKTTLEASDDAATVNLGGKWRIPSEVEWTELRNNCTWTWTTLNGVNGYKVQSKKTGYTDNWIFLPAAGYRYYDDFHGVGTYGRYWSSPLDKEYSQYAYGTDFGSDFLRSVTIHRFFGRSIRPVSE